MTAGLPVIVLAAGQSRRWGPDNKLAHPVAGVSMLRRVVVTFRQAGCFPLYIVTAGDCANQPLGHLLSGLEELRWVANAEAARGLGSSVRAGIRALLRDGCGESGFLISPADLPWLRPDSVEAVANAFREAGKERVIVPVHAGQPGHPVAFPGAWRHRAEEIIDQRGAEALIRKACGSVLEIPLGDVGVIRDCDRPEDLWSSDGLSPEVEY